MRLRTDFNSLYVTIGIILMMKAPASQSDTRFDQHSLIIHCKMIYSEALWLCSDMCDQYGVKALDTHTALGSEKTSAWMCIMRSPPAAYSMTKQTCSCVWKHANRLTRNGWRTLLTVSKILFSHIRLEKKNRSRVTAAQVDEICT